MEYPQGIKDNLSVLSEDELELVNKLLSDDQGHLFEGWQPAGVDDAEKHGFFAQIRELERSYPGGITAYTHNARVLLRNSRLNVSPFTGLRVADADPDLAVSLMDYTSSDPAEQARLAALEEAGLREVSDCAFVLVAGGVGERLGYNGIKIALASECLTNKSFIERYCESISELDARCAALREKEASTTRPTTPSTTATSPSAPPSSSSSSTSSLLLSLSSSASTASSSSSSSSATLPSVATAVPQAFERPRRRAELAIMTSEDTHARTEALLRAHGYFGLGEGRVLLVRQGRVACLADEAGHMARRGVYGVEAKPHGHGDVHALLHTSGLLDRWVAQGKRWVVLFQDTNALFFRTLPAILGASAAHALEVNNAAVPRRHREAIGALCKLVDGAGAVRYPLLNVEYNLIPAMLPGGAEPEPSAAEYSPYPGNINEIVLMLAPYSKVLDKTGGLTPEFVNPKYADPATRTAFASSARLECMMQDYPRSLGPDSRIGYTLLPPWLGFSPVKNSLAQAREKWLHGIPAFSPGSGEFDQYAANTRLLAAAGVVVTGDPLPPRALAGIEYPAGPLVLYSCGWAPTLAALRERVCGGEKEKGGVKISQRSALVIQGDCPDLVIRNLTLDGALTVTAVPGAKVVIDGLVVSNRGVKIVEIGNPANANDPDVDPQYVPSQDEVIRGYYIKPLEVKTLVFDKPGEYVVN